MSYELGRKIHPACSECGKEFDEYNSKDRTCSDVCARARKSRLQRERREKKSGRRARRASQSNKSFCRACRDRFQQGATRQRFCPACELIIKERTKQIEELFSLADETRDRRVQEECIAEAEELLRCHSDLADRTAAVLPPDICGWLGNTNRFGLNADLRLRMAYTREWVIASLKHQLHHEIPSRFPRSRQFPQKWSQVIWKIRWTENDPRSWTHVSQTFVYLDRKRKVKEWKARMTRGGDRQVKDVKVRMVA